MSSHRYRMYNLASHQLRSLGHIVSPREVTEQITFLFSCVTRGSYKIVILHQTRCYVNCVQLKHSSSGGRMSWQWNYSYLDEESNWRSDILVLPFSFKWHTWMQRKHGNCGKYWRASCIQVFQESWVYLILTKFDQHIIDMMATDVKKFQIFHGYSFRIVWQNVNMTTDGKLNCGLYPRPKRNLHLYALSTALNHDCLNLHHNLGTGVCNETT